MAYYYTSGPTTGVFNNRTYLTLYDNTAGRRKAGWLRFTGITIPQGTVITSAALKTYMVRGTANAYIRMTAVDASAPTNPTNFSSVASPSQTVGVVNTYVNNTGSPGSAPAYDLYDVDCTALIQSLVDSYDYDNGAIMFMTQINLQTLFAASAFMYQRDWGTTKAPRLVIDFEAPAGLAPDKTSYRYG
jgi:hypothetical protein